MAFGSDITETIGNVGGRTTQQGYGAADEVRKQYTGYERDDESGLDYAQARYYNSQHGRFTSVDPLASATVRDPQTFNRYSYVLNSPYKFTDPLGLIAGTPGNSGDRIPESINCTKSCMVNGQRIYGADVLEELRQREMPYQWGPAGGSTDQNESEQSVLPPPIDSALMGSPEYQEQKSQSFHFSSGVRTFSKHK